MRTRKITREYVRTYVPMLRRSRDEDLMTYWTHARDAFNENREGLLIAELAFREMMRRKRRLDRASEVE